VVDEMKSMLRQVFVSGTGRLANFGTMPLMGKSGTSNKGSLDRDLWFIAMTPKHVTGVWTGCDNEKGMPHLSNGSPSLHLWKNFNIVLSEYLKDPENSAWEDDDGHPNESKWAFLGKPGKRISGDVSKDHLNHDDDDDDDDEDEEEDEEEEVKSKATSSKKAPVLPQSQEKAAVIQNDEDDNDDDDDDEERDDEDAAYSDD
jgi:membrane peptidoglycan carboxypeptidase